MARSPLQLADLVVLLTIAEGGWGIRLPITNFMENGQALTSEDLSNYTKLWMLHENPPISWNDS